VDFGRNYKHVGRIYPFRDRPDVSVRVLWFPVSLDAPYVQYPNPFVLRAWDKLERLDQTELGTDQDFREVYTGTIPSNLPGVPCGTADEWLNGLLYENWLAGQRGCACGVPIFMPTVTTVRNDDGSLTVAPNTGDVEAHVNTSHRNDWLNTQTFKAAVNTMPAAEFVAITGMAAPYVQGRDQAGHIAWQISPTDVGLGSQLMLKDKDGNFGSVIGDAGNITLINHAKGGGWGVGQVDIASGGGHRIVMGNGYGQMLHQSALILTDDSDTAVNVGVPPMILILGRGGRTVPHLQVRQLDGEGGDEQFTVNNRDTGAPFGHFEINAIGAGVRSVATAHVPAGRPGIRIMQDDTGGGQLHALRVDDITSGPMIGMDFTGHLMTEGDEAPTGTGSIVRRWAVFDHTGSLIGYLPLYDSL